MLLYFQYFQCFYTFNTSILSMLLHSYALVLLYFQYFECFYAPTLSVLLHSYTFNTSTLLYFQHFYIQYFYTFNTFNTSILLYFQYFYTSNASALLWCALIIKCPHRFMILQVGEGGESLWVARANSILVPLHIYRFTVMRVCSYAGVQSCSFCSI